MDIQEAHSVMNRQFQSDAARAAFRDYIPSIVYRHKVNARVAINGGGVNHLPPSYPWAGTIVSDTFYGKTSKPGPLPGMTREGDDTFLDTAVKALEG